MKKQVRDDQVQESLEARIGEIERKLDRLRGLYETFFMGGERQPPNVPRREMNRLILEMQQIQINNASLRFRFQAIMQRWVLFIAYWNRTLREIESGTYRRDLARAQRHLAERGGAITEQEAIQLGIPARRAKAFVENQQKMVALRAKHGAAAKAEEAPAEPSAAPAAKAAPEVAGLSDPDIESVYRRYLEMRNTVGDPRPALTLDKIKERLRTQVPRILADKNCRRVKIDVAVEDGKVRLKAWPVQD